MNRRIITTLAICLLALTACSKVDDKVKAQLVQGGFSEERAGELAGMGLTQDEVTQLIAARKSGLDEVALIEMVKSMHDSDLRFTIGTDMEIMTQQGMNATTLTELVAMGAIPRWGDDIRAMKDAGVNDVTITEIAKLRFKEKKELLSGGEYGNLKRFGMSDSGVLTFARKGGTAQQLQKITEQLALGKSEQEALQSVGM